MKLVYIAHPLRGAEHEKNVEEVCKGQKCPEQKEEKS